MAKTKLQVEIDADSAKFQRRLQLLKNGVAAVGAAIVAIGATAAIAFVALANNTREWTRELVKNKLALDSTAKDIQALSIIAGNAAVDLDDLVDAGVGLQAFFRDVANGSADAVRALESLNLDIDKLQKLSPEERLLTIAEALRKIPKESRFQSAITIFGEDDAKKLNQLINSSDNLLRDFEKLRKSEALVSEKELKDLDKFRKTSGLVGVQLDAVTRKIFAQTSPALTSMFETVGKFINDVVRNEQFPKLLDQLKETSGTVAKNFKTAFDNIDITNALKDLTAALDSLNKVLTKLDDLGIFKFLGGTVNVGTQNLRGVGEDLTGEGIGAGARNISLLVTYLSLMLNKTDKIDEKLDKITKDD